MKAIALGLTLLLLTPTIWAAPAIGRLFMTPEERRQVDLHPERTDASGATNLRSNKLDEDQITINGMVTRHNGKRTVWINRQPLQEGQNSALARPVGIPRPATVELALPGQTNTQWLKAGQSYDQISGTISEGFAKKDPPPANPASASLPSAAPGSGNSKANEINPTDYLPKLSPLIPATKKQQ